MRVAVIENLIHRAERDYVVPPYLLRKGFLGDDGIRGTPLPGDISPHIIVGAVLGVLGIIERQTQAARRAVTQLHKDRLRVIAHVMAHVITVGGIIEHFYRVGVAGYVTPHELAPQRQALHRPAAPVEAHEIRHRVMLRIRFLETRELELIQEERTV